MKFKKSIFTALTIFLIVNICAIQFVVADEKNDNTMNYNLSERKKLEEKSILMTKEETTIKADLAETTKLLTDNNSFENENIATAYLLYTISIILIISMVVKRRYNKEYIEKLKDKKIHDWKL